ncbi:unnamed protein product [Rotaria socialis]|uniref:HMG box domain-containing protein n=1 Tax=Rotaria socialis TaxID=392032 RepID=A0A820ZQR6_9BILA|nr:unnamed protein product [Rotaria socialis]CAF4563457.1 unnamed protein product [Rotaria socialis]
MWTTGATHMIARLTGSTLFANHSLTSMFTYNPPSFSTKSEESRPPSADVESMKKIEKFRKLRGGTAFSFFVAEQYGQVNQTDPGLRMVQITKKIAELWKALPEDKRQVYVKLSEDQKAKYEQVKSRLSENDLKMLDNDNKCKVIERDIKKNLKFFPKKKPHSAYMYFLGSLDRGKDNIGNFMAGAARRWSQMAEQDKQKFQDLYEEEKVKYNEALLSWAMLQEDQGKLQHKSSSSSPDIHHDEGKPKSTTKKKASVKKVAEDSSESAVSAGKTAHKKSTKAKSDKENSSSSSSESESSPKVKRSSKTTVSEHS